jgi:hypothetical protein
MDVIGYWMIVVIISVFVILAWILTRPIEPKKPKTPRYPDFEMRLAGRSEKELVEEEGLVS